MEVRKLSYHETSHTFNRKWCWAWVRTVMVGLKRCQLQQILGGTSHFLLGYTLVTNHPDFQWHTKIVSLSPVMVSVGHGGFAPCVASSPWEQTH